MYFLVILKGENMQISFDCNNCDAIFHKNIEIISENNTVEGRCPFCGNTMSIQTGESDE